MSVALQFNPSLSDTLNLEDLGRGLPGITPALGSCFAEAAGKCLEDQRHERGVIMQIGGDCKHRIRVLWGTIGDVLQRQRAWNDEEVATEFGAYGIAAMIIQELSPYTVAERARKGPGFDFWLGRKGSDTLLFQDKARLEVSGVRKGNEQGIASRLSRKRKQISRSDGALPGAVIVVEFGSPRSEVKAR